jgi:hypothetical protein
VITLLAGQLPMLISFALDCLAIASGDPVLTGTAREKESTQSLQALSAQVLIDPHVHMRGDLVLLIL